MKNYIQPGDSITVPAPADVKSGDLVVVGDLFGVAQFSAKASLRYRRSPRKRGR